MLICDCINPISLKLDLLSNTRNDKDLYVYSIAKIIKCSVYCRKEIKIPIGSSYLFTERLDDLKHNMTALSGRTVVGLGLWTPSLLQVYRILLRHNHVWQRVMQSGVWYYVIRLHIYYLWCKRSISMKQLGYVTTYTSTFKSKSNFINIFINEIVSLLDC